MIVSIHNRTGLDKIILVGLIVLNALFCVYWCTLAIYSPLHYDDLHFLWKMREMSIFEYVKEMYYTRSGRFVGYALNGVKSVITDALGFHQMWAVFYYLLGLGICWLAVKDVKVSVSKMGLLTGMCFVYNLYILTNIDFPVFFWLCAMGYYLGLPMVCLLLKYLNQKTIKWWQTVIVIVVAIVLGGGNEAFTPIALLMMFVCGLYWWHSTEWKVRETWALPQVRRIVWVATLILVLLAIVVAAPGNYARMADTEQFKHPVGVLGWIKAMGEAVAMFFYFMAFYIPYYLIAFALAYYVGAKTNCNLPLSKPRLAVLMAAVFIIYLVISSLPNVFLYGGFGIQRSYTHIVFALLLTVLGIGFVMGTERNLSTSGRASVVGLSVLSVIMCVNIVKDTPRARAYGRAVDERIAHLSELRDAGQKETVVVEPLPVPYTEDAKHFVLGLLGKETERSVLYYISDTETDPNEYEYHMKKVLNLDFDFVLANEGKSE